MLYFLEQGEVEQKIIQQCLRENLPFPKRIADAPILVVGLEIYYLGFMELSDSRQVGMSLGPISWQTIHDYCTALELDGDQREEMFFHIRELDKVYLTYLNRKS